MTGEVNILELLPKDENLAAFIKRVRKLRGLTRAELAEHSAVNVSTIARLESGATEGERLRKAVQERIASALQIPLEYMKAASKGESVKVPQTNKVCLSCWVPGTAPDSRWSFLDAKFCLCCGEKLRNKCDRCGEALLIKGRFCPQCGSPYRK